MQVLSLQLHAKACGVDQAGHKQESIPPNLQGSVGLFPEQPQVAHKLYAICVQVIESSLFAPPPADGISLGSIA